MAPFRSWCRLASLASIARDPPGHGPGIPPFEWGYRTRCAAVGLANARHNDEHRVYDCLVSAQATRCPVQVGLVFIDMDRFKEINDRHGHAAGGALLVECRYGAAIREGA
ncbi:hypothetical protein SBBP2_960002 [Burkholderiales bacterium]|nr:hypothetical protein SBBP2_960002 [Burkholderiales bacterium]